MTQITEYSPSVPLPSVLCGSSTFSKLGKGQFYPSQTYDGYTSVEGLDSACTEWLKKGKKCFGPYNPQPSKCHHCFVRKKPWQCPGAPISNVRQHFWSKKDVPFAREPQVAEAPTPDLTGSRNRDVARWTNVGGPIPLGGRPVSSNSEVPISRINSQGVVKIMRIISESTTNPNAEGSDELEGEEFELVPNSIGHKSSASPSQPRSRRFKSQVIPSTPRNFQPVLSTIPSSFAPPSLNPSTARPSPIPQPEIIQ
ncbi:hypothetical protein O181_073116 [Austropuccinia psidii MF-1]|uniref:Uncharacterized protein n=1 Tax=Austropuccinia psidii MF-1 TaxID=1389203 RepID=A0A9Q3F3Z6_9BASI|nr:hypothetical protein [Austropuccinia psidii MF-1]